MNHTVFLAEEDCKKKMNFSLYRSFIHLCSFLDVKKKSKSTELSKTTWGNYFSVILF